MTTQNPAAIIERLGAGASAVVSCTCYLADLAGLSAFKAAYVNFEDYRPARTTMQARLIGDIGRVPTSSRSQEPPGWPRPGACGCWC